MEAQDPLEHWARALSKAITHIKRRLRWGLGKEEGKSSPFASIAPRLWNNKGINLPHVALDLVRENEVVSRQRNEREEPGPMV